MIVGSGTLDIEELEPSLRRALLNTCTLVVDKAFNTLEVLADGEDCANTPTAKWPPWV